MAKKQPKAKPIHPQATRRLAPDDESRPININEAELLWLLAHADAPGFPAALLLRLQDLAQVFADRALRFKELLARTKANAFNPGDQPELHKGPFTEIAFVPAKRLRAMLAKEERQRHADRQRG